MLGLTMKKGDYLLIGNDIKITFQSACGGVASIGVSAPKSVKITRSTLYEKIIDEKVARGDKKAVEISQTLTAERYEREQDILRKERLSQQIRERKAQKKAKQAEAEAAQLEAAQ